MVVPASVTDEHSGVEPVTLGVVDTHVNTMPVVPSAARCRDGGLDRPAVMLVEWQAPVAVHGFVVHPALSDEHA